MDAGIDEYKANVLWLEKCKLKHQVAQVDADKRCERKKIMAYANRSNAQRFFSVPAPCILVSCVLVNFSFIQMDQWTNALPNGL